MTADQGILFAEKFKTAYKNLYALHPKADEEDSRFRYLKVDWFFPNHLHNVLSQIKELGAKYFPSGDMEACLYAGLFHDAGLVYKRESPDALGHENRSVEYAKKELKSLGYAPDFIEKVEECIKSTEPGYNSSVIEAVIVRNADAYAHIISMHFFAKSNFSKDISLFVDWFDSKIKLTYSKISIPELQEEVGPLVEYYKKMIINYRYRQAETDFLDNIVR